MAEVYTDSVKARRSELEETLHFEGIQAGVLAFSPRTKHIKN